MGSRIDVGVSQTVVKANFLIGGVMRKFNIAVVVLLLLSAAVYGVVSHGQSNQAAYELCAVEANWQIQYNAEFGYRVVPPAVPWPDDCGMGWSARCDDKTDAQREINKRAATARRVIAGWGNKWVAVQ